MTNRRGQSGDDKPSKELAAEKLEASTVSPLTPVPRQATKHWAKQYRTELAAGSSSVFSTFTAVRSSHRQRRTMAVGKLIPITVPIRLGENPYASVGPPLPKEHGRSLRNGLDIDLPISPTVFNTRTRLKDSRVLAR